jgi:hypothetical protein
MICTSPFLLSVYQITAGFVNRSFILSVLFRARKNGREARAAKNLYYPLSAPPNRAYFVLS